jgi:hypothetical protein
VRILYYGEFDMFTGLGQTANDLRLALSEVALSCLLCDVVIVQPNNLLEHSSTLPVFEHLAPFVRAGRLTTTADASAANPHDYLHERVELTLARSRHLRRHPDSPAVRDLRGQGRAPRREGRRRAAAGGLPGDLRTARSSQADLRSIPPRPTSEA